ncbi:unnamed protein product [Ectocarpus sp. 6 AP-2014]
MRNTNPKPHERARRCRDKAQEQDGPNFRSMHNEVPFVWLKEHFEVDERLSRIEGQGAFFKRGAHKGKTVHTSVLPGIEFNDCFSDRTVRLLLSCDAC